MPRDNPPLPTPRLRQAGPETPAAAPPHKRLRHRHEAFCQHFVLLGNAADAAGRAGYALESRRNQGYRLMRQPLIQARVAAIRAGLARAYCLDSGVLLGKLEAVYQCAVSDRSFHAAARCVEIQARIAGVTPTRGIRDSARHEPRDGRGEDGRSPDRDTDMTTNDDILDPNSDVNRSNSTA